VKRRVRVCALNEHGLHMVLVVPLLFGISHEPCRLFVMEY
jgi:hypothetical protein